MPAALADKIRSARPGQARGRRTCGPRRRDVRWLALSEAPGGEIRPPGVAVRIVERVRRTLRDIEVATAEFGAAAGPPRAFPQTRTEKE